MGIGSFILLCGLMVFALVFGLRASQRQKREIRERVLAEREQLAGVIEVVRQGKNFQAENLLLAQGRPRNVARMTVVIIKKLLKSGELQ